MKADRYFALKKPCANCPFLLVGGIELREGRVDGIKADLLSNSFSSFPCHKTTFATGGETSDCGEHYHASGKEVHCAGATAFLLANRASNVFMRLSMSDGTLKASDYDNAIAMIDTSLPEAQDDEEDEEW